MALGLAGVIIFFLVSGVIAYLNLRTISRDNDGIYLSHEVIAALENLLSSAQDAETGQRGYLLTGNESYLEPYNIAVAELPSEIGEIARLTRHNPAQQQRIGPLGSHVAAKLAELKQTIDLQRAQRIPEALAIVNSNAGKREMDAIRAQVTLMEQEEETLRKQRLAEMVTAQNTALGSGIVSGLVGIMLTVVVGFLINRAADARRRQEWFQSGQVGLEAAMRGDQEPGELGGNILGYLAQYLGAIAGAMYVADEDCYIRTATYGVPSTAIIAERFRLKEGLLGEAAASSRPLVIDDVPDGYIAFGSALGQDKPRQLLITPGSIEGRVHAIIELGFIRPVDESVVTLLEQMLAAIAIVVRSAKYRADLKTLLEETQQKSEELQVQGEELRVSNEELEEQSRALKESQARLEQQKAELEQTNSQLEEQAQQLELQRDEVQQINATVQMKARELEQASRYKSDFLANMSHELRTPLNSSLILAKLLADNPQGNLTPEQVKYAQTIQSSGNDLLNLINDILDLSRIEAGHVEITAATVALETLTYNLQQLFRPIAQEKRLGLTIEVAPECPAFICTDLKRLEQILKNLLSNAFKFTEAGQVALTIRRADAGRIAFGVTDTGIGIPADQQERIFEAFHQADGTINRKFGGTGLGLSISRELVRLLGGTLQVKSRPGEGSTFTISIPESFDPALVAPRAPRGTTPFAQAAVPIGAVQTQPSRQVRRIEDDRDAMADSQRVLLIVEDDEPFARRSSSPLGSSPARSSLMSACRISRGFPSSIASSATCRRATSRCMSFPPAITCRRRFRLAQSATC